MTTSIRIRPARTDDLEFVLGLAPRLVAFGPPLWRDTEAIVTKSRELLREAVLEPRQDKVVLLAEDEAEERLGLIQLETEDDFFSGRAQGYVTNLAVTEAASGKGVGRALVTAAEAWSRERGLSELTLYVFADNPEARTFYSRLGFLEDSLRVVKKL